MDTVDCISSCGCAVHGVFSSFCYLTNAYTIHIHTHTHAHGPPLAHTQRFDSCVFFFFFFWTTVYVSGRRRRRRKKTKKKKNDIFAWQVTKNKIECEEDTRQQKKKKKERIQTKRLSETFANPTHRCIYTKQRTYVSYIQRLYTNLQQAAIVLLIFRCHTTGRHSSKRCVQVYISTYVYAAYLCMCES